VLVPLVLLALAVADSGSADTLVRIPGALLRLGWTKERAAGIGTFRQTANSPNSETREGDCRWFGSPAQASLTFEKGTLARIRLKLSPVAPHVVSYIEDELRRQGYRRVRWVPDSSLAESEWAGRTHIQISSGGGKLTADITPAPPPPSPPPVVVKLDTLDFLAADAIPGLPAPVRRFMPPGPERPASPESFGVFGRVLVNALVDTAGVVIEAHVARSIAALDSSALEWARGVLFEPYRHLERPALVRVGIPVLFLPGRPK
jgi:TonB family protein